MSYILNICRARANANANFHVPKKMKSQYRTNCVYKSCHLPIIKAKVDIPHIINYSQISNSTHKILFSNYNRCTNNQLFIIFYSNQLLFIKRVYKLHYLSEEYDKFRQSYLVKAKARIESYPTSDSEKSYHSWCYQKIVIWYHFCRLKSYPKFYQ